LNKKDRHNFICFYRTPDIESLAISAPPSPLPSSSTNVANLSGKQLSQSYNSGTSGKSSLGVNTSSQSDLNSPLNKTTRYD
jgi:hypothetical protein